MSFNNGRKMPVLPTLLWNIGIFSLKVYPNLSKTVGDRFWLKKALTSIVESFKGPSAFIQTEIGPGAANPGLFDLKYP
jgi:hypothetical protein